MLKRLIHAALKFPWAIYALVAVGVLVGGYAFTQVPIEAFPDVNDKQVLIITQAPGNAPEEMEQQITLPIERALGTTPGMTRMRSVSMFALSVVTLTFNDASDDYFNRAQVNERLGGIVLPPNVTPTLGPLSNSIGEIYRYWLEVPASYDLSDTKALQDWVIAPQLRTVEGVADVTGFGGTLKQYQIRLDPAKLQAYGISAASAMAAIAQNNQNTGGAIIEHGDEAYTVRGIGLARSLGDLGAIAVGSQGGTPVLIKDLGSLALGFQARNGIVGINERADVVQGIVLMRKGLNPTSVCSGVASKVAELNARYLPPGVRLVKYYDRRELVDKTLETVTHNLISGAGLVFAILLIFLLELRTALIVAVVIPLSLLFAFSFLWFKGIPGNLLSLGAIDFGIIVDGAVVMVEAVFVRFALLQSQNDGAMSSAGERVAVVREVATHMARPIVFAKLIIICALLPILSFQRVEGRIFAPMAWTLGAALVGSLLLTITLVPVLASQFLGKRAVHRANPLVTGLEALYKRLLVALFKARTLTLATALSALVGAGLLASTLGSEFLPKLDEGNIWLTVEVPIATSLTRSKAVETQVRQTVRKFQEVTQIVSQIGRPDDGTDPKGFNHMEIAIDLAPKARWRAQFHGSKAALIEQMATALSVIPGAHFNFSQYIEDNVNEALSGVKGDIALKLYGPDLAVLNDKANEIKAVLSAVPGVADLDVEQQFGLPQVCIKVDRTAVARHGLQIADVMDVVAGAIGGKTVSTFFEGDRRFDVVVRFQEQARDSLDKIRALELVGTDGSHVTLWELAKIEVEQGAARISREGNSRRTAIKCSVRGRDQGGFVKEAQAQVAARVQLPAGYLLRWEGQFENQQRATARLRVIVPICVCLIFGLLIWTFGRVKEALLVLANVPFSLIGGIVALKLTHINLSVSALVGFIALFGMAVENGVILVSQISALRELGYPKRQAIHEGALSRLRPVVMTALMAGMGLLPAAISTGIGSEVQRPLAVVIVGGLLTATVLTLGVLPVLYDLFFKETFEGRSAAAPSVASLQSRVRITATTPLAPSWEPVQPNQTGRLTTNPCGEPDLAHPASKHG